MRSDLNLPFIRACATNLGAAEAAITDLERDQYLASGESSEEQATRLWKAAPWNYLKSLGLQNPVELQRGARVLNPSEVQIHRPWTVAACGAKRVTLEREACTTGSGDLKHTWEAERVYVDVGRARYTLLPFPAEHEDAVVGFVLGFVAHSATMAYYGFTQRLCDYVVFRSRLLAMLKSLEDEALKRKHKKA